MQDKYIGDIGDFSKYFLLRSLMKNDLTLGIDWYWHNDEPGNDGGHTNYLSDKKFEQIYPKLFKILKDIVCKKQRKVERVERYRVFPESTKYFRKEIPLDKFNRDLWLKDSLNTLKKCDLIFLDPDNGLEVKSCPMGRKKSVKYVYHNEVKKYYEQDATLIIYQHRWRSNRVVEQAKERKNQFCNAGISEGNIVTLYSPRGSGRIIFINQLISLEIFINCFFRDVYFI